MALVPGAGAAVISHDIQLLISRGQHREANDLIHQTIEEGGPGGSVMDQMSAIQLRYQAARLFFDHREHVQALVQLEEAARLVSLAGQAAEPGTRLSAELENLEADILVLSGSVAAARDDFSNALLTHRRALRMKYTALRGGHMDIVLQHLRIADLLLHQTRLVACYTELAKAFNVLTKVKAEAVTTVARSGCELLKKCLDLSDIYGKYLLNEEGRAREAGERQPREGCNGTAEERKTQAELQQGAVAAMAALEALHGLLPTEAFNLATTYDEVLRHSGKRFNLIPKAIGDYTHKSHSTPRSASVSMARTAWSASATDRHIGM
eukprot:Sspe_Gene.73286::Locus_44122_Transcript_1_1_Confidence_1.000_Length_1253::g.73286::m.73286